MSYVPSFTYDIFLSYSHAQRAWVAGLKDILDKKLQDKLGQPVSIWIDAKDLRSAPNYVEAIKEVVQQSALLLTINSPSYLASEFCAKEVTYFKDCWIIDGVEVPRAIQEIYLTTTPTLETPKIQKKHNGIFFYKEKPSTLAEAVTYTGDNYDKAVEQLAVELSGQLFKERNKKRTIYISMP